MFLTTILSAIGRHLRQREAIRRLSEADEHMLADLGISRGQITDVVQRGR